MARYAATRRSEPGKKPDSHVSVSTVNKELRHLKAVLRKAAAWEYLPKLPDFEFLREAKKVPRYVTSEDFVAIYDACQHARRPADMPYSPADWWCALLVFQYQGTGWRKLEPLSLRWADVDLDGGRAILRSQHTKGRRGETIPLHPVVIEHLRRIEDAGGQLLAMREQDRRVFPWPHHERTLDVEYHRIQKAAGIHLPCSIEEAHTCTGACHVYGFHDLRRGFATMNATRMTGDSLQALMRHKSYTTTQRYINMAQQLDSAVAALHVPEILQTRSK
jgi:integrase